MSTNTNKLQHSQRVLGIKSIHIQSGVLGCFVFFSGSKELLWKFYFHFTYLSSIWDHYKSRCQYRHKLSDDSYRRCPRLWLFRQAHGQARYRRIQGVLTKSLCYFVSACDRVAKVPAVWLWTLHTANCKEK